MKLYCASPFFNPEQLSKLERVEAALEGTFGSKLELFKPRNAKVAAKKLNQEIGAGKDPSGETRKAVFRDNVENVYDSDLMVAVIDGRDIGVLVEIGLAFARDIPIITYTDENFGLNLMVAEAVHAHCKGVEQLCEAVSMFIDARERGISREELAAAMDQRFKRANLTETKQADVKMPLYAKGE